MVRNNSDLSRLVAVKGLRSEVASMEEAKSVGLGSLWRMSFVLSS